MGNLISLLIAAGSLLGTGVLALVTLLTKRGEIAVDAQTNLTAGQLGFLNLLSEREMTMLKRMDHQELEIQRLRHRCSVLETIIRRNGLDVPVID
jgi:hypothetical protein